MNMKAKLLILGVLSVFAMAFVSSCKDEESFIKSQKDTPGGSAANTVIGLARLGCPTSIIGKIA